MSGPVGFSTVAVALTWPWARELWSGSVGGDAAQFVWDAWWVQERVFALENPWRTELLYAPEGTYLAAHPLETLLMALASPLTALAGPMVTYGLLVLVTLTAAGLFAWRLGLALGLGHVGAVVVGVLWMSAPIVVFRAPSGLYMLLLLAALLPAALLLAHRLLRTVALREAVWLGVFLGACLLTDLQVTTYLLLALTAVGLYAVVTWPVWRTRAALARAAVVVGLCFAIGLPVLLMIARSELDGSYRTPTGARVASATAYSADLAQFALPSPASRFFGDVYAGAADRFDGLSAVTVDSAVTLGWAATALAVVGIVATRRSRRTWWLAGAVVVGAVLSLGPAFKVFGEVYRPLATDIGENVSLVAPATWLLGLPVVNDLRVPARYMQLGALPLVLLAGLGARALVGRARVAGLGLVGALCALALAEGAVALRAPPATGDALARLIRDDPRAGIVVDVPLSWRSGIELVGSSELSPRAMVQQTIHGKPIAAGYIARLDRAMLDRLLERPLYRALLALQGDGDLPPGLVAPSPAEARADARALQAHWIVVWPEADRRVLRFLAELGYRRVGEADGALLYSR